MPEPAAGVHVRPATAADQTALGRMGAALMRQHHAADPERFILTEHPETGYGRFLVSETGDPDSLVLVAEREGVVVGYLFAAFEPMSWKDLRAPCAYLHDLLVEEPARRSGVASRLLAEGLAWAAARGLPRMVLSTAANNAAAQAFFARMGFRRTMIEMTRELGTP